MNLKKLLPWVADKILIGDPDGITGGTPPKPPETLPRPRTAIHISLEEMTTMAAAIAKSGMFGLRDEAQALSLMLLCQAEGLHPALAVRRYHIIDGKPSMRADALQGEFEQSGAILWHERTEQACAASLWRDKRQATGQSQELAMSRYRKLKAGGDTHDLERIGQITIIRTLEDAVEKKVAMSWKDGQWQMKHNWKQSPRQMLHARCLSEGVRAIAPGLIAGIYVEDEAFDIPENGNVMTPEDRVRQATENATSVRAKVVREPEIDVILTPTVTEENYNDIICHIGKAEGTMLGKSIREIHPNVLQWLKDHYGEGEGRRWGNPPDEKDEKLKQAVDLALKKLNEGN